MQHSADIQPDAAAQPTPVRKDFDGAFCSGRRVDGDESVVERPTFRIARDDPRVPKRNAKRRDDVDRFLVVDLGEQIDVLRGPRNEPMRDHGPATRERQRAGLGKSEGDARDSFLQRIQRHTAMLPAAPCRSAVATPRAPTAADTSAPTDDSAQRR